MHADQPLSYGVRKGWGVCRGAPSRVKEVFRERVHFLEGSQLDFDGRVIQYLSVENRGMRYGSTYIFPGERKNIHEIAVCQSGLRHCNRLCVKDNGSLRQINSNTLGEVFDRGISEDGIGHPNLTDI